MSVAAGRSLLQGITATHLLTMQPHARRLHGPTPPASKQPQGHWQSPSTTTTLAHALSRERRIQFPPTQAQQSNRQPVRGRAARASAGKDSDNNKLAAVQTAPSAEHAAAHPPLATFESRGGDPGASTSGTVTASRLAAVGEVSRNAAEDVATLRAELNELRQLVQAQTVLTEQQELTISSLQRTLRATPSGSGPSDFGTTSSQKAQGGWSSEVRPFEAQIAAIGDRRFLGGFDARFHSTNKGATPRDYRVLPPKIILVRHAESEGNVDNFAYTYVPDPQVPLTERGKQQALGAGHAIRALMEADGQPYKLFFYTSPYKRSRQTYEEIIKAIDPAHMLGAQEEVQLREQDFGNFQDVEGKEREKTERLRFGRFWYRFPHGESGADVYDRMTIFEDHMIRDINAGRYSNNTSLVLVTHGLALRIFLMRFFHWTVDQFLEVFNPPNAAPLVLERVPTEVQARSGGAAAWIHTKALYRLSDESREIIRGCTAEMCCTSSEAVGFDALEMECSL